MAAKELRRCPFSCAPVESIEDVSTLTLGYEHAYKLGPLYVPALSKR